MINIGVVILNYLSYDVTIKCVEYFQKQSKNNVNVKIVVVDNASPNNSFNVLYDKFKSNKDIKVVKTPQNLGFARGNNFGYKELCKIMNPDFVVISNSDAYVKDDGLYNWIIDCYEKYNFSVLGPSVYSVYGQFYQSPSEPMTRSKIKIREHQFRLILSIIKSSILMRVKVNKENNYWRIKSNNPYSKKRTQDKTLHGAFQIFSKNYFMEYTEPYDGRTFLYVEEDILRIRCDLKGLVMLYSPDYKVYHLQAMSSNRVTSSFYKKQIIRNKNTLYSLNIYLKYCKLLETKD